MSFLIPWHVAIVQINHEKQRKKIHSSRWKICRVYWRVFVSNYSSTPNPIYSKIATSKKFTQNELLKRSIQYVQELTAFYISKHHLQRKADNIFFLQQEFYENITITGDWAIPVTTKAAVLHFTITVQSIIKWKFQHYTVTSPRKPLLKENYRWKSEITADFKHINILVMHKHTAQQLNTNS